MTLNCRAKVKTHIFVVVLPSRTYFYFVTHYCSNMNRIKAVILISVGVYNYVECVACQVKFLNLQYLPLLWLDMESPKDLFC